MQVNVVLKNEKENLLCSSYLPICLSTPKYLLRNDLNSQIGCCFFLHSENVQRDFDKNFPKVLLILLTCGVATAV